MKRNARNGSLPVSVAARVRRIIVDAEPGSALPSESRLAERFKVGRTTVREALKLIEQEGLLDVRHGSGRYVRPHFSVERPITRLESVTEMLEALGFQATSKVLSLRARAAEPSEAEALALSAGALVVVLDRLRLAEGEVLICSRDVVPDGLIGTRDERAWAGSLLELLAAAGEVVTSASARISAATLPEPFDSAVPARATEPWLLMQQTNLTDSGRPVITSRDYHRGDLFTFDVLRQRPVRGR
jgi:GntR family transcriptional regulator